ncbi:MAG: UMP kinase [Candidatus Aenigmatarchaeota archaeon]|nr:MAG: UMP kinase [Candidatus Aenigmarchaeota archaeon]
MKKLVISLGGSVMVPEKIDVPFLSGFRKLLIKHAKKGKKFFIIAGGGKTCRDYQKAAKEITKLTKTDLDWIGIHATRFNAEFLKHIFKGYAYEKTIENPTKRTVTKKKIVIGCGWKPGCSTDKDAVLIAKTHKIKTILNVTNIDYIYDKDPAKHRNAKPIKTTGWKDFLSLIGNKWEPGAKYPFDPVASRLAQKLKLRVVVLNGKNLKNLDNFLSGKPFKGSVIE